MLMFDEISVKSLYNLYNKKKKKREEDKGIAIQHNYYTTLLSSGNDIFKGTFPIRTFPFF